MNKEIERLNSAKSYAELKMLSLITRKENLIEWIVKNPAGAIVLENFEDFDKCISKAEDDYAKTIMTIALPCNMEEKTLYYNYIKDEFCRMKITEGWDIYEAKNNQELRKFIQLQIPKIEEYKQKCDELKKCKNEDEKTKYIIDVQDNDMKISLLSNIKENTNREKIFASFNRYVDKDTKELDRDVRTMIWDFINDHYNGKIPKDKKEHLMMSLQRTNCKLGVFDDKCVNGHADYMANEIVLINDFKKMSEMRKRELLIHEYAHMMSTNKFKQNIDSFNYKIEEGNADLFAEMVINHYMEKNKIPQREPYVTSSAYNDENALVRTLLYPLQSKGKDKDAIMEYMLGDKEKYYEQVLSKDKVNELPRGYYGQLYVGELDVYDAYKEHEGEYDKQLNSIYLKRNDIIDNIIEKDKTSTKRYTRKAINAFVSIKELVKNAIATESITRQDVSKAEQAQMMKPQKQKEGERISNE